MLISAVVGGLFALIQWRTTNQNRRAEFVSGLIEKIHGDKVINRVMYMFDYQNDWYNEKFHNKSGDFEQNVDKTLSMFSYICYLRKRHLLREKDFQFFEYEIKRIADNYSVQAYLFNLYHFSKTRDVKMSFIYLFEYCCKNNLFNSKLITNKECNYYPKYLNF